MRHCFKRQQKILRYELWQTTTLQFWSILPIKLLKLNAGSILPPIPTIWSIHGGSLGGGGFLLSFFFIFSFFLHMTLLYNSGWSQICNPLPNSRHLVPPHPAIQTKQHGIARHLGWVRYTNWRWFKTGVSNLLTFNMTLSSTNVLSYILSYHGTHLSTRYQSDGPEKYTEWCSWSLWKYIQHCIRD